MFLIRVKRFLLGTLDFLLFTSLFTTVCVLALCMTTERLVLGHIGSFLSPLHLFLAGSTLVVYNLHYLIKKSTPDLSDQYAWVQKHKMFNYLALLLGLALCIVYVFFMPKILWQVAILLAVGSFAYSLPILPFAQKQRLKDFGGIKIVLITLVWTTATAILPILYWGHNVSNYPFEIALRFLLMLMLCLAFDIRDMEVDLEKGIYTLPNSIGLKNTNRLIYLTAVLFISCAIAQYSRFGLLHRFAIDFLTGLCSVMAIFYVQKHPSDKNYQLFVDGQMLLNGLLILLF